MKTTLLLLVVVVLSIFPVMASSEDFDITKVYVNGIQANSNSMVQVELGSTTQIAVFLEGTGATQDVRIRAWVGGYEYGDIEVTSEVFDLENGVSYKKYLYLDIPEDLSVNDHEFTLTVQVYSGDSYEDVKYTLYFEEERHKVIVEDIMLSSTSLEPGSYLGVKVRLSNEGENDEQNLKITLSIPELGISNRVYMDELSYSIQKDSSSIYLTIPQSARSGNYELVVSVEYNNGYSESQDATYFFVDSDTTQYDENTLVSVQTVKDLAVGQESVFKVQVTNLGDTTKTFTLEITGMNSDQTQTVTASPGKTGELTYAIEPITSGLDTLLVEITSTDGQVSSKLFYVDVANKSYTTSIFLGSALLLVFLALLSILLRQKR
jgi:hypothetical protein